MSKVIVIGGGAAGMMAAIAAQENGHKVVLLEKNEKLGKKIYITGKGRCNITNACEMEDFFKNVVRNPKFLYSACYSFDQYAVMRLLEEEGCKVKIERGERVFPVSDHASDVINALKRRLMKLGVQISLNTKVKELLVENDAEGGKFIKGVLLSDGKKEIGEHVIVATGALSYPTTGSDGDGYKMAEKTGHAVTELKPALVPFNIKEEWCKELQGLSLKNINITVTKDDKEIYSDFGEMLFTHFGVSGPVILSASSHYANKCNGGNAVLHLDLKPALNKEQLDKRVLHDFEENINKQFKNTLQKLFPLKLIPVMIALSGIPQDKKVNEISKEERLRFVNLIKDIKMTIIGTRGYNEAIITQGGISIKDINPSTMESKKIKGLSFAGEVIDVDALTGGFNLQIAWSTGYLAGNEIK